MKYSLGISNFLEEVSSLSQSIVFLYFFTLISEEGFLISPCYSLELCIEMSISFLFASLLFSAICKASSDSIFLFRISVGLHNNSKRKDPNLNNLVSELMEQEVEQQFPTRSVTDQSISSLQANLYGKPNYNQKDWKSLEADDFSGCHYSTRVPFHSKGCLMTRTGNAH